MYFLECNIKQDIQKSDVLNNVIQVKWCCLFF